MSRWLALILVAAFVLVGAGGFLLYDRTSSSAEMGRGRVLTDAAPFRRNRARRQSPHNHRQHQWSSWNSGLGA